MADEISNKQPAGEGLVMLLFGLFIISQIIAGIPKAIEKNFGFDVKNPGASYAALTNLSETTPLGSGVRVTEATEVFSRAGGGVLRGVVTEGMKGVLTDGPLWIGRDLWWDVDFDDSSAPDGWVLHESLEIATVFSVLDMTAVVLMVLSAFICVALAIAIAYVVIRLSQIRTAEKEALNAVLPHEPRMLKNPRWDAVEKHINSSNPNDWRQAIIEADILLDEMVTRIGYRGESLGEKLKQIEKSDFYTLESAWEAHKIRNRIAHDGANFQLSQRDAQNVIHLYREVFEEFEYI